MALDNVSEKEAFFLFMQKASISNDDSFIKRRIQPISATLPFKK
jgi:hypothetical protein